MLFDICFKNITVVAYETCAKLQEGNFRSLKGNSVTLPRFSNVTELLIKTEER